MSKKVEKQHFYKSPISEVWEAISDQDQISAWFIQADFKAEIGYEYTFKHEDTTVTGKVLESDPVTNLVYTWIVGGTEVETEVRWTLEEKDGGTLLTIRHTGFENYSEETAVSMFSSTQKGWDAVIKELTTFLSEK